MLVLQNCLVSEKNGFVYLNEIFTLTYPGQISLEISPFLVELLLRESNFGHTHTQSTLAIM